MSALNVFTSSKYMKVHLFSVIVHGGYPDELMWIITDSQLLQLLC